MAARTKDSYVINANHISLPHFLLISMQTSNEAPPYTQSQHTDKPSCCVKKTQTYPRTVTMLTITAPLHQRVHVLNILKTDSWLEKSSPARLQTNFQV